MTTKPKETARFAMRGKALTQRVRAFSAELEAKRASFQKTVWPQAELLKDPATVMEIIQELDVRGEQLSVAEEELCAQLEELSSTNELLVVEQARHQELFDFFPDPLVVTDSRGGIRAANNAAVRILGAGRSEILRKPFASYVSSEDSPQLLAAMRSLVPGATATVELLLSSKPTAQLVEVRGFRSHANDHTVWSMRDITAERDEARRLAGEHSDLENHVTARTASLTRALRDKEDLLLRERERCAELETQGRAKDRFLAILSHDLRSPLNAVLGWTGFLRREMLDKSRRDRALEIIERNARVQADLIEALLDVSRMAAGQVPLEMRSVDFARVARGALEAIQPAAEAKGIELVDGTASVTAPVLGDVGRLQQVMSNLIGNALKFTPSKGRIEVEVTLDDEVVRVCVADTGRGIAPEILPDVFDCFRQSGDPTTNRAGLGLGLFIVKQVVELHGGEVHATSEVGRGSQFVVVLPRRARASQVATPPPMPAVSAVPERPLGRPDFTGQRLLVVEDDADTRELLALALEGLGARVISSVDGEAGLEAYKTLEPDAVVSDLGLPGMNGCELLRQVRAWEAKESLPRAPALAVSAFTSAAHAQQAFDAGFDVHLSKPLALDELAQALYELTRHASLSQP